MNKFPSSPTEYEQIVRDIYQHLLKKEGIETKVRHNVTDICGKSGTYPQLDVYWCFKVAGMEHSVVIDCKNYNNKVSIDKIRNLYSVIQDIGATKGVIVSTIGYQEGAEIFAKTYGIDLKIVRSPREIDWSGYIQAISVNTKGIYKEFTNFEATCSVSHDKYLKNLAENRQLKLDLTSTNIKLYNVDGSLYSLSFKEFLSINTPVMLNEQPSVDANSHEIFPKEIYLEGKTLSGKKVLVPLVKLKVFYKNCITEDTFTINMNENIEAVLQDHISGEIEYMLTKKEKCQIS